MPIPGAAVTRLNTYLANLVAAISSKQDVYHDGTEIVRPAGKDAQGNDVPAVTRVRNRYWQGLKVLASPPADGATASPNLAVKPSYQMESWADMGISLGATVEIQLWIDQYVAPGGNGWVIAGEVVYGGRTYRRSRGFGPEAAARTSGGWDDVTPATA